jgi:ROS/MUCR transcriptional regulator protein
MISKLPITGGAGKLSADYPLTAPSYSARRSTLAKEIGLGRKSQDAVISIPAVAPPPKRRGRKPRSAVAE